MQRSPPLSAHQPPALSTTVTLVSPHSLQQPCNEKLGSKAKSIFIYYPVLQFLSSLMEPQPNPISLSLLLWPYWPCGGKAPWLHPKARQAPRVQSLAQRTPMTFQFILPPSHSSLAGMSSTHAGELTSTPPRLPEQTLRPKMGWHGTAGYPQPMTRCKHHASYTGCMWLQLSWPNPAQHCESKLYELLRAFILHWKHGTALRLVSSPKIRTGTAPSAVGQE